MTDDRDEIDKIASLHEHREKLCKRQEELREYLDELEWQREWQVYDDAEQELRADILAACERYRAKRAEIDDPDPDTGRVMNGCISSRPTVMVMEVLIQELVGFADDENITALSLLQEVTYWIQMRRPAPPKDLGNGWFALGLEKIPDIPSELLNGGGFKTSDDEQGQGEDS